VWTTWYYDSKMYAMPNGKRWEELGQERETTLQSFCHKQMKASSNCMPNYKNSCKENKISNILINLNKPVINIKWSKREPIAVREAHYQEVIHP